MNTTNTTDDLDEFYSSLTVEQRQDADIVDRLEFAADLGIEEDDELFEDAMLEICRLRTDRANAYGRIALLENVIFQLTGEKVSYK